MVNTKIKTFGSSMEPFLYDGDIISISPTPYSKLKINDIITIQVNNQFITHRIVHKTTKWLLTKGDNNPHHDGKIIPRQIIGRVNQIIRQGYTLDIENFYLLQSTIYTKAIHQLFTKLQIKKIDFVTLKGLPIHLEIEKTYPRRYYVDCDLLIQKDQFNQVKKILSSLGYKPFSSPIFKSSEQQQPEESFSKIINGFIVTFDIHLEAVFLMTQISNLNALYPDKLLHSFSQKLLREKKWITIQNTNIPILSSENLLIYLLLHLFHHNFNGYYRYILISNLIHKRKINWQKAIFTLQEYKLENYCLPALLLLKKIYPTKIPTRLLDKTFVSKMSNSSILKLVKTVDIFQEDLRLNAGVKRFFYIYSLSPMPFYRKIVIFFNPEVIRSIKLVLSKKIQLYYLKANSLVRNLIYNPFRNQLFD